MTDLLIGIDVGTTSCKAALVSLDGRELAHGRRPTPWTSVATGAEVDPHGLVEASVGAALDALASGPTGDVRGIGVCSMGETGVMLDQRGEPLAPGIAWYDTRGGPEAERMADDLGAEVFTRVSGLPVGSSWTAPKLESLLRNHPDVGTGRRWLSIAEWVVHWLGGDAVAELSLASRTGLLDVSDRTWWSQALDRIGLSHDVLPRLVQAGTPVGRVTRVVEFADAVLTVSGHDHPCASVGAGAVGLADAFDSCGTANAILRSAVAPVSPDVMVHAAALGITVGCHVVPDRQALLGFFKGGMALTRFLRLLGVPPEGRLRDALDREALTAIEGTLEVEGIAEDAQVIRGIDDTASRGALWAAAQRSAALETARILERMASIAGVAGRLVVSGGWSRNEAYRAIKREVLGPFQVPVVTEAGARGAALYAGLAAGFFGSVEAFPTPEATASM